MGIRTATDLLTVAESDSPTLVSALEAGKEDFARVKLTVLLQVLMDEEWVQQLRDWRGSAAPRTVTIPGSPASHDEVGDGGAAPRRSSARVVQRVAVTARDATGLILTATPEIGLDDDGAALSSSRGSREGEVLT
jgi:hypothetical protein